MIVGLLSSVHVTTPTRRIAHVLERALRHSADLGDAQKLAAMEFLVQNMPGRGLARLGFLTADGACEKEPDTEVITAECLIDHTGRAFEAWRSTPWGRRLDFDVFGE